MARGESAAADYERSFGAGRQSARLGRLIMVHGRLE
jgi:hypothetical protein